MQFDMTDDRLSPFLTSKVSINVHHITPKSQGGRNLLLNAAVFSSCEHGIVHAGHDLDRVYRQRLRSDAPTFGSRVRNWGD